MGTDRYSMKTPTLWIFGDSFAMDHNHHKDFKNSSEWFWGNQIAQQLGTLPVIKNFGEMGCSNEYIQYTIKKCIGYIKPDDYVIIITTDKKRAWFWKDRPYLGNYWILNNENKVSKEEAKQLKSYILLGNENETRADMNIEAMVAWCHFCAKTFNWRMCILPGFDTTNLHHGINGSIQSVDICEFIGVHDDKWQSRLGFFKNHNNIDPRIAHLSEPNHNKLAEEIVNFMNIAYSDRCNENPRINLDPGEGWATDLYDNTVDDYWRLDPYQQHSRGQWGHLTK